MPISRIRSIFAFMLVFSCMNMLCAQNLNLRNIFDSSYFTPKGIKTIVPAADGKAYRVLEDGKKIIEYPYLEKEGQANGKIILDLSSFDTLEGMAINSIHTYIISSDPNKILLAFHPEPMYRHSFLADWVLWNLKSNTIKRISPNAKIRELSFSPDARKLAYVRDNNLYYFDIESDTEYAVSTDGEKNKIINACTDWVYEEEFGFTKAYLWTQDSESLFYLRFDESHVKEFSLDRWGKTYPEKMIYKYPKAGEDNSALSVWHYTLENKTQKKVLEEEAQNIYYPQIMPSNKKNSILLFRLNRHQNHLKISEISADDYRPQDIYEEVSERYVEAENGFMFLKNTRDFILMSEKDGYRHIYLYSDEGKTEKQLTSGNWEVAKIYGVNEMLKRVYFAAKYSASYNQEIMWVNYKTGKMGILSSEKNLPPANDPTQNQRPLLFSQYGAGYSDAYFSSDLSYAIVSHSHANAAPVYALWKLDPTGGKLLRALEDNSSLNAKFTKESLVNLDFGEFTSEKGHTMPYWILEPKNKEAGKKYPLFMYLYGGPGSQQVLNRYGGSNYLWFQYLLKAGYIVVCVDGRGTGGKGEEYKKSTYLQLGKYETEDQIEAARYFAKRPYIDGERIGIWGWSYGGFMSTSCLLKGNEVFKMAMAVAPVTHWKNYDNIYTERYMRTPAENSSAYEDNSPLNFADRLKGAYLLVHGTGDDNVHVQQSYELAKVLQTNALDFDIHLYINKDHSIYGGKARFHLYNKLTNFLLKNL